MHAAAAATSVVISALFAVPALAQGWIESDRPPDHPLTGGGVTRVASNVQITVDGHMARVEIEERFRNDGPTVAEGSYFYPLPGEAVFQNFSLWIGEQEIRGEMLSADQARGVYEDIVRRRKDPALLTLARHGLVRARVFPIEPGATRKVVLRYTQLLARAGDVLRLRYAMGDRGGAGSMSFRLDVAHADQYGTPYSPTHRLETHRTGDRVTITLPPDASGDVELLLPLQHGFVGTTLLTHAPLGEDGYFMLLVAPPAEETGAAMPRDVTLVVDISGSMSGPKLEQAKAALRQTLSTLAPADRFRLIAFASSVREFRPGLTSATRESLADANRFLDGLSADGGTNIAGALDAALDGQHTEGRLPVVVFLTDGLPSVGEQLPDRIAERAASRLAGARIFTVGIGHDVNTYLLDRLALEGHGSVEYVAPDASVEMAVGAIAAKIRHPALVNLRIGDSPVTVADASPAQLPDLFYGEELVVLGRYRGHGTGDVVVTGERNGRRERFAVHADFPTSSSDNDFIPRLWASRRVGDLTRQIRLEGGNAALIAQVRDLGLRYGILTEYTSYLVQEPTPLAGPVPVTRLMPAAAPATGQTGQAAFEDARASAKLSSTNSLDAADAASSTRLAELRGRDDRGPASRAVAGRLFLKRGEIWTDAAHYDSLKVTAVAPFSDAYFALIRALPEIAPWLKVGDEVLIAGRRVSIRIAPSGISTWRAGQLDQLTRDFRGV